MSKKIKFSFSKFSYSVNRKVMSNYPQMGVKKVAVFLFDKMTDYNLFTTTVLENTTNRNARRRRDDELINVSPSLDFHGTLDKKELTSTKEKFRSLDFIKKQVELFATSNLSKAVFSFDNKKTLRFNDRELGIFSFDLASAGIHKVKEYYSELLKTIVDPNEVETKKDGDEYKYFYTGTPYHEVEQRDKLLENGLPKLRTSVKKVFIDIPKPKKSLPQIDIFVTISFSGTVKPDQMHWNALALITVAEKLISANISTRIWAVFGLEYDQNSKKANYSVIKIKDFSEPLDINTLGILSADSRFFRYDFFKGAMGIAEYIGDGDLIPYYLGYPINELPTVRQDIMNAIYDLEMYDLPDEKIMYEETKLFLTGVWNENDAKNEFTRVMTYLEQIADRFSSPDGLTKWKPTDMQPTPQFEEKQRVDATVKEPNEFTLFRP
jgi:hypothetical protein